MGLTELSAIADNPTGDKDQALKMLSDANTKLSDATSFYGEQQNEIVSSRFGTKISVKIITKVYKMKMPDGQVFSRIESTGTTVPAKPNSPTSTTIEIQNDQGLWQLVGKVAIQRADVVAKGVQLRQAATSVPHGDFNANTQYSIAEKQDKDMNFYVITETFSEDRRNFGDKLASEMQVKPSTPERKPAYEELWISKDDQLLYKDIIYSVGGDILKSDKYNLIKLNVPLDDTLFTIPESFSKKVVNSEAEYNDVMTAALFGKH
jgi:hypothetical protein